MHWKIRCTKFEKPQIFFCPENAPAYFFCCNTHLRQISCDLGSEYLINLDLYLQQLGIRLTRDGSGVKSTTSIAELSISLLKTCLRQASLHDPRMWPQYLPQCIHVINSLPLYDTNCFIIIPTSIKIWFMLSLQAIMIHRNEGFYAFHLNE